LITNLEKSLALAMNARPTAQSASRETEARQIIEPDGVDLLAKFNTASPETKDEPWPEIRNLPV
jgi:hypothetical protein